MTPMKKKAAPKRRRLQPRRQPPRRRRQQQEEGSGQEEGSKKKAPAKKKAAKKKAPAKKSSSQEGSGQEEAAAKKKAPAKKAAAKKKAELTARSERGASAPRLLFGRERRKVDDNGERCMRSATTCDAEHDALDDVVATLDEAHWSRPTPAAGWSVRDQISHLWFFDQRAAMALRDADEFAADTERLMAAGGTEASVAPGRSMTGAELARRWRADRAALLSLARTVDPSTRVPWYGPAMGARSLHHGSPDGDMGARPRCRRCAGCYA